MKIAVLGANGFVGSNLARHLSKSYIVIPVTRAVMDVLDPTAVKNFLAKNEIDVIVNCATTMKNNDLLDDSRNNFGMFMNFYDNRTLFSKFINMASGAEFDRETDINEAKESLIFSRMPKDSYGWGQNMKARLCSQTEKFYNIRIFNCFGLGEKSTRTFPKFLQEGYLEISNDRYFDYFSIQDLKTVVQDCIEKDWAVKDVNAVYERKYKISQVLEKFCVLNNYEPNFRILSTHSNNYTGSGLNLKSLGINLLGLDHGLKDYLKED